MRYRMKNTGNLSLIGLLNLPVCLLRA